jgi:hypothetical protein
MADSWEESEMGELFTAGDTAYTLLFVVAGVLAALESKRDLLVAKFLVIVGAIVLFIRWGVWAVITEQSWPVRVGVGAIIGALLLGLVPAAIHWLTDRAQASDHTPEASHTAAPNRASPPTGNNNVNIGGDNSGVAVGTNNGTINVTPPTRHSHHTPDNILTPGHMPSPPIPKDVLEHHPDALKALKVVYGTNLALGVKLPLTLLRMAGDPMVQIDRKPGSNSLVVSVLRIFDDRNDIIARVDEGEIWVQNLTRNKRPDPHTLVVFDHTDTEVLRLVFLNPTTISVTGIFRHSGISFPVIITPDSMDVNTMKVTRMVSWGANTVYAIGDPAPSP